MTQWKKVKIDFPTIKLGNFIEPIKSTVYDLKVENPIVYGVTNKEGIVQTGKPSSKDISNYIMLENDCFAFNPYRVNVGSIGINDRNITGCVSPAYVVFKTKNGLLPKFLYFYLKSDYGIHLINWYGNRGGVRNALRYSDLCDIDIPDIREIDQHAFLNKFTYVSNTVNELTGELEKQKSYIKQLRQNILQDAIEGKLTADWRKNHPVIKGDPNYDAETLFEQIQKEKTDKKQKKLPPIMAEEKPFDIPEGWKWVKLGNVCEGFIYGTSAKSSPAGICPVLRMGNIQNGKIDWEKLVFSSDVEEIEKYKLRKFDLLFNRTNSREMVGKTAIFEAEKEAIYAGYLVRFRPICSNSYFINIVLNSKTHREWCNLVKVDALGQSNINAEKLRNFVAPFPPFVEQEEIVNKVGHLLAKVTELENQIAERENMAKQLMQSILKDAFGEG
ncbi:restriction endonuclease subunit S [bacterium]|nr:restriction endonuclease subunit S [bacterium]